MRIVEIAVVLRVCRRNTATVPAVCGLFELFAQLQIDTEALAFVRIENRVNIFAKRFETVMHFPPGRAEIAVFLQLERPHLLWRDLLKNFLLVGINPSLWRRFA